jgi:hypothetical protein
VVCEIGPLLHLSEANIFYLLRLLCVVTIPPVMIKELEQNTSISTCTCWVMVNELDETYRKKVLA